MPIRQVLYTSQAKRPLTEDECRDILRTSRVNNRRDGLTGFLIFLVNGTFVQVLEGDSNPLNRTMARIRQDPRHESLGVVFDIEAEDRAFGEWEMAFRSMRPEELENAGFENIVDGEAVPPKLAEGPAVLSVLRNICLANARRSFA